MTDRKQEFDEILAHFDTAMLVTRAGDGTLRARPMAIAGKEANGDLWFATAIDSPKVDELLGENQVCASMQSGSRFLTISGRGEIVRDRQRIEQMWKPTWKAWFPNGKDDPKLVLLRLAASEAEYWDQHGAKGLAYLIEGAKAVLRGEPAKPTSDKQHAKLQL
jgi:general stress protein 26